MYFNPPKKHQVFLTPLTERLGCTGEGEKEAIGTSAVVEPQNVLSSQGEQGGIRKMHFPLAQELLRGREWGCWIPCCVFPALRKNYPGRRALGEGEPLGCCPQLGSEWGAHMEMCCVQQWGRNQWCNGGLSSQHLV